MNSNVIEFSKVQNNKKNLVNENSDNGTLLLAKTFRDLETRKNVPNDKPGYYKWWASKKSLELLLNSSFINKKYLDDILPFLCSKIIDGKDYYYIYVGIAVKESIYSRINWHIRQSHTISSLKSGYLSTFRFSLCSLLSLDYIDEISTNKFIDELYVEYFTIDEKIKSKKAKNIIEKIEKKEIENNNLPINISGNNSTVLKPFIKELKKARKLSKK